MKDIDLLVKYRIPSMGDYSKPGSELCKILTRLETNSLLNEEDKTWIKNKGMFRFYNFIEKWEQTKKPNFNLLGPKKDKYFYSPVEIVSDEITKYAWKYGISIDNPNSQLYQIFKSIQNAQRFRSKDIVFLTQKDLFRGELKKEYHRREAQYYEKQYLKNKDLWNIVNASSHYRKANQSKQSVKLIDNINLKKVSSKTLKSALIITQGGAYRDLHKFDLALKNAQKGFSYDPSSFHPCTLFGALYYELGKFSLGDKWFAKAVTNGAKTDNIDSEIRSIYKRSNKRERSLLQSYLLRSNPKRYRWVKRYK